MHSSLSDDVPTTLLLPRLSAPGAEDAWGVFLKRYWPLLVDWARRRSGGMDDAEQIASEVLLKLSCGRALASFDRRRGRFRPWLCSVLRRAVADHRRAQKKVAGGAGRGKNDVSTLDSLLDPASIDGLAEELDLRLSRDLREAEAAVTRVRARIKPATWEAYYRTAILGQSAIETADALGLSASAVYMAKKRVGEMLREEGRAVLGQEPLTN